MAIMRIFICAILCLKLKNRNDMHTACLLDDIDYIRGNMSQKGSYYFNKIDVIICISFVIPSTKQTDIQKEQHAA